MELLDDGVGFILDALKSTLGFRLNGSESTVTGGGELFHDSVTFRFHVSLVLFGSGGEIGEATFDGVRDGLVVLGRLEYITGGLAEGCVELVVGVIEMFSGTVELVLEVGDGFIGAFVNGTGGAGGYFIKFSFVSFDLVKELCGGVENVIT